MHAYSKSALGYNVDFFLVAAGNLRPGLAELRKDTRARQRSAFRPGTHKNHITQFRTYIAFCTYFDLEYLQPSSETMCWYAELLNRSFKSPDAVKGYISAIRLLHKLLGRPCEAADSFDLTLTLRGIELSNTHFVQKKLPITLDLLCDLCDSLDTTTYRGKLFKCVFLLAFFSFLRRSNLTPEKISDFDIHKHLCRGDVFVKEDGIYLLIKWSKTLQTHDRVLLLPLCEIPGHRLCPKAAFMDMVAARPATPNAPLFCDNIEDDKPLTARTLTMTFKGLLSQLGVDASSYSIHSFRRGGATLAFSQHVDPLLIKAQGDWKSDAYLEYISLPLTSRIKLGQALALAVTTTV